MTKHNHDDDDDDDDGGDGGGGDGGGDGGGGDDDTYDYYDSYSDIYSTQKQIKIKMNTPQKTNISHQKITFEDIPFPKVRSSHQTTKVVKPLLVHIRQALGTTGDRIYLGENQGNSPNERRMFQRICLKVRVKFGSKIHPRKKQRWT